MTSYEFERALVYLAEQIIKTFGKDVRVQEPKREPAEPLIKDEKIRKAVRAWAEANTIRSCICKDEMHCITFETERGMFISFEYAISIPPEGNFTITELCGEEE